MFKAIFLLILLFAAYGLAAILLRRLTETTKQLANLREQMARLRQESVHDRERWKEFMARKIACEKEMAWAVGFVLDRPVVSISAPPPDDASVE